MRFVDDRVMPRHSRRPVVSPGKRGVYDARLRRAGRAVALIEGEVTLDMPNPIAEVGVAPDHVALEMFGVRFDQKLVWIEAMTPFGVVRAVHAVPVEQPWACLGQV